MNRMDVKSTIIGCVVADALGVPYEFISKLDMKDNPATTMTGLEHITRSLEHGLMIRHL